MTEPYVCDRPDCGAVAANSLKFTDYPDAHTHTCKACTGFCYEYMHVTESHPMPCPWPHLGDPWSANISHLET